MKKLLALICCVLCLHSFSQSPIETEQTSKKLSGEKVLIKMITVIVNPHANKKLPVRTMNHYSCDRPRG